MMGYNGMVFECVCVFLCTIIQEHYELLFWKSSDSVVLQVNMETFVIRCCFVVVTECNF